MSVASGTGVETDASLRTRLLEYFKQTQYYAEWYAALTVTGRDLDKLAGIYGLIRRGGDGKTPVPWEMG
jgi:hypothetical protein